MRDHRISMNSEVPSDVESRATDPGEPGPVKQLPSGPSPASGEGNRVWHVPPFRYSALLRVLTVHLSRAPWPWGEHIMAVLGVVQGLIRPSRFRWALDWARGQRPGPLAARRLALSLLWHRGRFLAKEALVGVDHLEILRRSSVVNGAVHLGGSAAAKPGNLLLGFHLGPAVAPIVLRAHGLSLIEAVEWPLLTPGGEQDPFLHPSEVLPIYGELPSERARELYRARRFLLQGHTLFITGDGRIGKELFRIPVPGGDAVIRRGWWILRRQTKAPTLPVLNHSEGSRVTVTIYPPLPSPDPDAARDLDMCREHLSVVITQYVRRFPGQCLSLAFAWREQER